MKWDEFIPSGFEYDWEKDKLREHSVALKRQLKLSSMITRLEEIKGSGIVGS